MTVSTRDADPVSIEEVSAHVSPNTQVFAGFATASGIPCTTEFKEDYWSVGKIVLAPNLRGNPFGLRFSDAGSITLAISLKEFAFARIRRRGGHFARVKPLTMHRNVALLFRILADLHETEGIASLGDISQAILDRWLARNKAKNFPVGFGVYVLQCLYAYSPCITEPMRLLPWKGKSAKRVTGKGNGGNVNGGENKTPRIPEAVAGPLLQWALRYVDEFSEQIIAAVKAGEGSEHCLTAVALKSVIAGSTGADRLRRYIKALSRAKRGFQSMSPALPTDEEFSKFLSARRVRVAQGFPGAHRVTGVDDLTSSQLLVSATETAKTLDGSPAAVRVGVLESKLDWECRAESEPECLVVLRRGSLYGDTLAREVKMLTIAAYIVVDYLSGMRDSEVQSLRRGCLKPSGEGAARRWKVRGRVWKNRGALGDPEEWVVIEPAARAIGALERLHTALGSPAKCYLFRRGLIRGKSAAADIGLGQGIAKDLVIFIRHANALAVRTSKTPPIPDWEGRPWPLNSRQFRRTLAWHIVNRPFGTLAGLIQYKHAHLRVMEGYGGQSESGFGDELLHEQALGNMESLVDRFDDWTSGVRLAGQGASSLEREFQDIHARLGGGAMVADDARLREMLKHRVKHLHPGVLNDCHFDPKDALCGGTKSPLLDACHPASCRNSTISLEQKVHWVKHRDELDSYLMNREKLPAAQIEVVELSRSRVAAVLASGKSADLEAT